MMTMERKITWKTVQRTLGSVSLVVVGGIVGAVAYRSWTKEKEEPLEKHKDDLSEPKTSKYSNTGNIVNEIDTTLLDQQQSTTNPGSNKSEFARNNLHQYPIEQHQKEINTNPSEFMDRVYDKQQETEQPTPPPVPISLREWNLDSPDSHGMAQQPFRADSPAQICAEIPEPHSSPTTVRPVATRGGAWLHDRKSTFQRKSPVARSYSSPAQGGLGSPHFLGSTGSDDQASDLLTDSDLDDSETVYSTLPRVHSNQRFQQSRQSFGHVFIVFGDLTKFECDAWAIPTRTIQSQRSDKSILRSTAGASNKWFHSRLIDEYDLSLERAVSPEGRCTVARVSGLPEGKYASPFLVSVSPSVSENAKSARDFLQVSENFLRTGSVSRAGKGGRRPRSRRSRFLVALPVLGTGAGGARQNAGLVIHQMLDVLHAHVATDGGIDVALVTNERETYAAAQAARMSFLNRRGGPAQLAAFPLSSYLRREGNKLAALAKQGKLALFIGAGMSVSSGLPLWEGLLDELAVKAGLTEDQWGVGDDSGSEGDSPGSVEVKGGRKRTNSRSSVHTTTTVSHDPLASFHQLGFLDRARVIEQNLSSQGIHLGEAVSKVFQAARGPALGTCLLASLPVEISVTTNYDNLFEDAWGADGAPVNVLPHEPRKGTNRTLLKMHGCVKKPREIVLTRGDYLGYAETKAALGALVQSVLLTKHMLFVGFSLGDDNFNRLFYAVQKASEKDDGDAGNTLGTVLAVTVNPLQVQLWENHMQHVSMEEEAARSGRVNSSPVPLQDATTGETSVNGGSNGGSAMNPVEFAELCRLHDIFLDYLAFKSSDVSPHLLTPRFTALLTKGERMLSGAILRFLRDLPDEAKHTVAWRKMSELLLGLGLNPSELHSFHSHSRDSQANERKYLRDSTP